MTRTDHTSFSVPTIRGDEDITEVETGKQQMLRLYLKVRSSNPLNAKH